jgi:hypothetical protein
MGKARIKGFRERTKWSGSGSIKAGLGLVLLSLVVILPVRNTKAGSVNRIVITDDVTLDYISFSIPKGSSALTDSAFTGAAVYLFHQCSTDFQLSGSGVESDASGTVTLNAKAPGQIVSAGYNLGQGTGKATIYYLTSVGGSYKVYTITQKIPRPMGELLDCESP